MNSWLLVQRALALSFVAALAGCMTNTWNPLQASYNQCVEPFNTKFRHLAAERVMVVGVNNRNRTTQCFWAWGSSDAQEAHAAASANCRHAGYDCRIWADSSGMSSWVRQISDNGGRVPGSSTGSGWDADSAYALGTVLGYGIGTALSGDSGGSGGSGNSGGSSYSGSDDYSDSGGSYDGYSGGGSAPCTHDGCGDYYYD